MIRAGKLDHLITLERLTETVTASGAVSETWAPIATVRAEVIRKTSEEFLTGTLEGEHGAVIFRIRWISGLTTADRITCEGETFDLEEIVELGRRRALELRANSK
ncbi:head-tail adaptor protein [Mameliella sp. AT18]|uniref:head-tail adaptor protein n=1 Tax=Mameliella sp. AT18 TaxID=3028385 RepID=UPI00237A630E|nr:head-tail adaptor protein [Mameliella sp. AT18]MDD9730449.1 head-tail adaptor protein [Mameliella sp. AT18]